MRKIINGIAVDFDIEESEKVIHTITASLRVDNVDYYYSFEPSNLELTYNEKNLDTNNETEGYYICGHNVEYLDIPVGVISKIKEIKESLTENIFLDMIEKYGEEKGYGSDFYFLGLSKDERKFLYEHSC